MSDVPKDLQNLYAEKVLHLQRDFEMKLQSAQSSADLTAIQKCVIDFQVESANLMIWFNQQLVERQASLAADSQQVTDSDMDIYSHEYCAANLNRLAYRGDRNQMQKFMKDPEFNRRIKEVLALNPMGNTHKALLSKAMRLTPSVAPHLFRIVERVKETLGMRVQPELFALQSTGLQAGCYPIIHGRLPMAISSGLLEKFSEYELAFIIGREFAHALFYHFRVPVDLLVENAHDQMTPVQFLRLAAWERARAISADRVGLLCCGSFEVAATAFFKLSSGIVSEKFHFQIDDYMGSYRDLEQFLKAATDKDVEDLYAAHPFNPIRLKALELFSRSVMFKELSGQGSGDVSDRVMEQAIHGFCRLLEPSYLDDSSETARLMREFVFYSGLLLARTDGEVTKTKIMQLASFLEKGWDESRDMALIDEKQIAAKIQEYAEKLDRELPVITKLNLVHDLATMITSGAHVSDDKVRVLAMICEALGVDPMFTMAILPPPETAAA